MNLTRFRAFFLFSVLLLATLLGTVTIADAMEIKAIRVPGGIVTDDASFSAALGGNVIIMAEHDITISRDLILEAPLIIQGGEYVFNGAGCKLIRGFEKGDLITVQDGAKIELGRPKKEGEDVSLIISGAVKTIRDENGAQSCTLSEEEADIDPEAVEGALLRVSGKSQVILYYGTEMIDGHSSLSGGGVICDGGTFMSMGGIVQNCSSSRSGGCVLVQNKGHFVITLGEVKNGYAAENGGLLAIEETGEATIAGGVMTGGYAKQGGGISAFGTLDMQNGNITLCHAQQGGGVYYGFDNELIGAGLSEHTAELGGAIYIAKGVKLDITELGAESNHAEIGGAIYNCGSVTLVDGVISSNQATTMGGGFYNAVDAVLYLESGTIGSNVAAFGGGIFNAGMIEGKGISIATNRADLGEGMMNTGTLNTYQGFYCSAGNSLALLPDENGKGTLTIKEAFLPTQMPSVVPVRAVDDRFVIDYQTDLPLLSGDAAIIEACSKQMKVEKNGSSTYALDSEGRLKPIYNWILPVIIAIIAVAAIAVGAVIVVRRRRAV